MKHRKKLLVVLLLFGLGITFFDWLNAPSKSPETAIKKEVIKMGHPFQALSLEIEYKDVPETLSGEFLYIVEGFEKNDSAVKFFYLTTNTGFGTWKVISVGTGP